jgi:hypothetical protein
MLYTCKVSHVCSWFKTSSTEQKVLLDTCEISHIRQTLHKDLLQCKGTDNMRTEAGDSCEFMFAGPKLCINTIINVRDFRITLYF